jgi:hypothetical protein
MPSICGQLRNLLARNEMAATVPNPLAGSRVKVPRELDLAELSKSQNCGSRPAEGRLLTDDVTLHDPKWKSGDGGHAGV